MSTDGLYGHWIQPRPNLRDDPAYAERRDWLRSCLLQQQDLLRPRDEETE